MANAEGTGGIRQCYLDIVKADTTGDYEKALKACNRLLKKYPKEGKFVYKCKLVALIQLGQWEDAVTLIKKTSSGEMGNIAFEKAYISYHQNKNDEALEELSKCDKEDIRAMELKAQILYRLNRFGEANELYTYLLKNHSDDNDEERKANVVAVHAQLAAQHAPDTSQLVDSLDTFEQLYNAACVDIEKEKWKDALKKLDKAIPLCEESLRDSGLTEEEAEEEGASLVLQKAFVLHRLGRTDEARVIYHKIETLRPSDVSVMAAVLNNVASLSGEKNLTDARKKMKSASQLDQSKLSRRQRVTLLLNNALVLLLSNQREPSKRALDELLKVYGPSRESELTEAALHWKAGDAEKAVAALPSSDPLSILARLHILVNLGRVEQALGELSSLPADLQAKPAVVALAAALLQQVGKPDQAITKIEAAKNGWKSTVVVAAALNHLASVESKREKHAEAAKHLEQLAKLRPDDMSVTCRLIRAYSHCEPGRADSLRESAFPDSKRDDMNVDELEDSDWILYGEKYKQKKEAKEAGAIEDTEIVTGKLRKRKRKRTILPKNLDPNATPDPESCIQIKRLNATLRWLPKQERSAYKKKRKNREREVGRGTQGAAASSTLEYKGADPTTSPMPAGPIPGEGPRQQRPAQQKKKKAKGGKW